MKQLLKLFNQNFIDSRCVLCNDFVSREISLCHACESDLLKINSACLQCAIPMLQTEDSMAQVCGECLSQKAYIDYAFSLYHYVSPMADLITQMKFANKLSHASILDHLVAKQFSKHFKSLEKPQVLLPIPLHPRRLAKRGFNQSLEISRSLSNTQNIPIALDLVDRIKNTSSQTDLNKKSRHKNVKDCFKLLQKINYSHIVIVDDVVTTGATTKEMAKLLKKAGVDKVGVLSLARADIPANN